MPRPPAGEPSARPPRRPEIVVQFAGTGKLSSEQVRCLGEVKVFEVRRGRDPKVTSGLSSATGGYVAKEPNADGRYYAEVGETAIPGLGTCLEGKSRSIKLG
ncbi:MAG TPA: hypothetical protein VFY99_05340 [Solirubrobacterales bacterium]